MSLLSTNPGRALFRGGWSGSRESWAQGIVVVCAEVDLLGGHGPTPAKPDVAFGLSELKGASNVGQNPDGENSMFITIPPPFIELPVKMSEVAMCGNFEEEWKAGRATQGRAGQWWTLSSSWT
jgi:hypothetical protein